MCLVLQLYAHLASSVNKFLSCDLSVQSDFSLLFQALTTPTEPNAGRLLSHRLPWSTNQVLRHKLRFCNTLILCSYSKYVTWAFCQEMEIRGVIEQICSWMEIN